MIRVSFFNLFYKFEGSYNSTASFKIKFKYLKSTN